MHFSEIDSHPTKFSLWNNYSRWSLEQTYSLKVYVNTHSHSHSHSTWITMCVYNYMTFLMNLPLSARVTTRDGLSNRICHTVNHTLCDCQQEKHLGQLQIQWNVQIQTNIRVSIWLMHIYHRPTFYTCSHPYCKPQVRTYLHVIACVNGIGIQVAILATLPHCQDCQKNSIHILSLGSWDIGSFALLYWRQSLVQSTGEQ